MITSINLSSPRKYAQSIINDISFQRKMKKIHSLKYNNFTLIFFLYLLMNAKCVMAKESNPSNDVVSLYDYLINFFQVIGFPTIDVIFNCIRFRKPFYDYIKYIKQG